MEQSAEKYRRYDFSKDPGWLAYLDNIYPTPPLNRQNTSAASTTNASTPPSTPTP